jgi:hypothetical protein
MTKPCPRCGGSGLTAEGRAVTEGRLTRRYFAREDLFCRFCGGKGTVSDSQRLGTALFGICLFIGLIGFWTVVLLYLFR